MKITIDTKEDSHEDIRKVIRMLSHLVGEQTTTSTNIFENSDSFGIANAQPTTSAPQSNSFANFFDSPSTSSEMPKTTIIKESDEKIPEIIPY